MVVAAVEGRSPLTPFRAMPEPPRRGLGGHLSEWLGVQSARSVLARLQRYAEACGPLARVTLGPARLVAIHDAAIAARVLEDPRANFKGATYILTRAVLDNVLLLNGEAWRTHRLTYRAALKDVDAVRSAVIVTQRHLASLRWGPAQLDALVSRLVGDVVGHFVAGVALTDEFDAHRRRVQHELAGVGIDLQCRPWAYLSASRWLKLRQSVAFTRNFFRDAVEARRASAPDQTPDILGGFLSLAREGRYPRGSAQIQDGLVNFFFTAHDVLASSTTWCLHLLARHPSVQARLRAELTASPSSGAGARAGADLLARVVRESLRLFPGYSLFGRTTQEAMDIGGFEVPRGTVLIVSPFVIHRLERHFPRAATFDPDRWLGLEGATMAPAPQGAFMPFGAGARACLASHLAVPVMKTIVAEVVKRVELLAPADHEPDIAYWGTAYSENGLPVLCAPAQAPAPAQR